MTQTTTTSVFVINLDRAQERLEAISSRLNALGVAFERVPAVDGASLSQDEILKNYDVMSNKIYMGCDLSPVEIGCYLSHKFVWELVVNKDLPHAVVLEDDAVLTNKFPDALEALLEYSSLERQVPAIVYLCGQKKRTRKMGGIPFNIKVKDLSKGFKILVPGNVSLSTIGYFITNDAAKELLNSRKNLFRAIDVDLAHLHETSVHILNLEPKVVHHNYTDSYIKDERDLAIRKSVANDDFGRLLRDDRRIFEYNRNNLKEFLNRVSLWSLEPKVLKRASIVVRVCTYGHRHSMALNYILYPNYFIHAVKKILSVRRISDIHVLTLKALRILGIRTGIQGPSHMPVKSERVISHKYKFFYVVSPKVASRSIIQALLKIDPDCLVLAHETTESLLDVHPEVLDYYRFAFVRNPIDRVVSCFREKVASGDYLKRFDAGPKYPADADVMDFNDFCLWLSTQDLDGDTDRHWATQTSVLQLPTNRGFDYIGHYETLEQDWAKVLSELNIPHVALPKINTSRGAIPKVEESTAALLKNLYNKDFANYGYNNDK